MLNIIMPVYNTPIHLFKRAIYSYLCQTKKALLFVVDDHSDISKSTEYEQICKRNNIGYIRLPKNVGPGAARQYGIDNGYTNCEYISFLDADDILLPHYTEILVTEISKTGADIVVGKVIVEGKNRMKDSEITIEDGCTWLHGKIYRRSFLEKNNISFHSNIWFNEDVYFNLKVYNWSKERRYINRDVYIWQFNKNSVTRQDDNDDWGRKHNIGFFLSNLYILEEIFYEHKKNNIGCLIAQLYNSYQEEIILNGEVVIPCLDFLIHKHLSNYIKEWENYTKNNEFLYVLCDNIKNNRNLTLYNENIKQWLNKVEVCILDGEQENKNYNFLWESGAWERYRGEFIEK